VRILLSEGASTSAREAITALGVKGHHIEVCDPSPHCLGRFSRFVHKVHRCPGLRDDPAAYLHFMLDLVARQRFDVLLPIHEQGLLFAKVSERLRPHVGVALPSFESYRRAHSKAGFSRLLSDLGLPQPATRFVTTPAELRDAIRPPCVVKSSIATASRGIWLIDDGTDPAQILRQIEAAGAFEDMVLVQEFVQGPIEHAQAVFHQGRLVAMHAYRQLLAGAGGGPALKESVGRPAVEAHLAQIGQHLAWHGALSVDYILTDAGPRYVDCNPRLVEPMSAALAGLDLADFVVRISQGERPTSISTSCTGVRTHLAMQVLLGIALRENSRRELLRQFWHLFTGRGTYAGSTEELTPVRVDWLSAVPLAITALLLLANPRLAHELPKRGWGAHLLDARAVRLIEQEIR
jgi:predicted ATP-grasp superfamily ATP-dependent carboligase